MNVELIDYLQNSFNNIIRAGRGCYGNEEKKASYEEDVNLVKAMIKQDHSPIEFGEAIFFISGISRACANQLNRYRLTSQAQKSQRYTNAGKESFVHPYTCLKVSDACVDLVDTCFKFYDRLVKSGVPKEDARYYLPIGISTSMHIKCNFRQLRHILKQRLDKHAQTEIRSVAKKIFYICDERWPWLVEDIKKEFDL